MELAIIDKNGEDTGKKVFLPQHIFGVEPNDHAIYLDVKQFLANKRQGTHKTKQRSEISGSTRKLRKQKGIGSARVGSVKSPIFKGGGRVFGPKPRDYSFKLNKKLKKVARRSALAYKVKTASLTVVEDFIMEEIKTKKLKEILESIASGSKKPLLVLTSLDKKIYLSSRNLNKVVVTPSSDLNTYDILNADRLILFEGTISNIERSLN